MMTSVAKYAKCLQMVAGNSIDAVMPATNETRSKPLWNYKLCNLPKLFSKITSNDTGVKCYIESKLRGKNHSNYS